jgi:hypothetical protein
METFSSKRVKSGLPRLPGVLLGCHGASYLDTALMATHRVSVGQAGEGVDKKFLVWEKARFLTLDPMRLWHGL